MTNKNKMKTSQKRFVSLIIFFFNVRTKLKEEYDMLIYILVYSFYDSKNKFSWRGR